MLSLLSAWFDDLSTPIILLRGYSSQTYIDEIAVEVSALAEPAVLIYAGDLDPSGMDIERDFCERSDGCFSSVVRIAVEAPQIDEYRLIKQPGKTIDTRAPKFINTYGSLFQVEIEAIEPETLRGLYQAEIDNHMDLSNMDEVLEKEKADLEQLDEIAEEN